MIVITPGRSAVRNTHRMVTAPARVGPAVQKAMTKSAIDTKRRIVKDLSKDSSGPNSGRARRNQGFDVIAAKTTVTVKWNVRYIAYFLERGTKKHTIKGFVRFPDGNVRRNVTHPGHRAFYYVQNQIIADEPEWNRNISKAVSAVLYEPIGALTGFTG